MEEILENTLIADLVAEEQRRNLERRGRRSGEPTKLQEASPVLSELRLKEQQLQEREHALRAREQSLERESALAQGAGYVRVSEQKRLYPRACRTFFSFETGSLCNPSWPGITM